MQREIDEAVKISSCYAALQTCLATLENVRSCVHISHEIYRKVVENVCDTLKEIAPFNEVEAHARHYLYPILTPQQRSILDGIFGTRNLTFNQQGIKS